MKKISLIFKAIFVSFPASLFAGAVIISIGFGSLLPQVDAIAHPLLTSAGNKIVIEKQAYSYAPGQGGIIVQHLLVDAQGAKKDVTFKVGVYSSFIYTIILMGLSLLSALVYMSSRHLPFDGYVGTVFLSSVLLALLVSGAVLIIAVFFFAAHFI